MATHLKYKVFNPAGEQIAACLYAEDAAALVAILGDFASIRMTSNPDSIVWRQGELGDGDAGESYDTVRIAVHEREKAMRREQDKARAKAKASVNK